MGYKGVDCRMKEETAERRQDVNTVQHWGEESECCESELQNITGD